MRLFTVLLLMAVSLERWAGFYLNFALLPGTLPLLQSYLAYYHKFIPLQVLMRIATA